eukprot:2940374-Rhodomonas_salina.1
MSVPASTIISNCQYQLIPSYSNVSTSKCHHTPMSVPASTIILQCQHQLVPSCSNVSTSKCHHPPLSVPASTITPQCQHQRGLSGREKAGQKSDLATTLRACMLMCPRWMPSV